MGYPWLAYRPLQFDFFGSDLGNDGIGRVLDTNFSITKERVAAGC
jgi:hypothetical protein